jgi:prepilin-type N-terminal cleavage/methylation domain-containing protein
MSTPNPESGPKNDGFTLVEVMVALVILSMSVVTIVALQRANVRSAVNARQLTVATLLARSVMVDAYLHTYRQQLSTAIHEEKTGETEMADMAMKWTWTLRSVPLELPESFETSQKEGSEADREEDQSQATFLQPIMTSINDYLGNAMRELAVKVTWTNAYGDQEVVYVTHLVDFSYPLQLPSFGGAPTLGTP